jgi:hypothetical protein
MLEVEEVLRANIDTVIDFEGLPTERRTPSVPFEALQQLYRNALLHRTYESSNAPVRASRSAGTGSPRTATRRWSFRRRSPQWQRSWA